MIELSQAAIPITSWFEMDVGRCRAPACSAWPWHGDDRRHVFPVASRLHLS